MHFDMTYSSRVINADNRSLNRRRRSIGGLIVKPFTSTMALLALLPLSVLAVETPASNQPGQAAATTTDSTVKPFAKPQEAPNQIVLFDGKSLDGWRIIDKWDFTDHGPVTIEDGNIVLGKGDPATGISWKGELPKSNYELTWQAKRTEGSDFFCGLTFPVKESFCTLILGGWGGQIVGLSNIDGFSAVENPTTQVIRFEENRWYRLRLKVTDELIEIWLDDKSIIKVETEGRKFSIWWEQEPVTPLGIVTWNTAGVIKGLEWKTITPDR